MIASRSGKLIVWKADPFFWMERRPRVALRTRNDLKSRVCRFAVNPQPWMVASRSGKPIVWKADPFFWMEKRPRFA